MIVSGRRFGLRWATASRASGPFFLPRRHPIQVHGAAFAPVPPSLVKLATLAGLGIGAASARALGSMTLRDRAALISADIERFGEDDVATILGTSTPQARRAAATARRRYVERHPDGDLDAPPAPGSIGARVVAVSQRTMGGRA